MNRVDLTLVLVRGEVECKGLAVESAQRIVDALTAAWRGVGPAAITLHGNARPNVINAHQVVTFELPDGVTTGLPPANP